MIVFVYMQGCSILIETESGGATDSVDTRQLMLTTVNAVADHGERPSKRF